MTTRLNLVLLYGGKSGEHEISLISAASVMQSLDKEKYNIIPVGMDKEGQCYRNDCDELLQFKDSLPIMTAKSQLLPGLLLHGKWAIEADVVFPMVHGPLYEDGCLQGILQLAGVAFVGSGVMASAIGMDKDMTRRLALGINISCARYESLSWHANTAERAQFCQRIAAEFTWPMFVKPNAMGSSVGIHKVTNLSELADAIEDAFRYDEVILVEEGIIGREIELAVLENSRPSLRPLVSVPGEIVINHADGFYSYTAKYLDTNTCDMHIPASLPEHLIVKLQHMAGDIFMYLKCRGMARVDFFVNDDTQTIYFNEINTLPGFTPISMYPKLWQASGRAYPLLLDSLITQALNNHRVRQQLITNYK